MIEMLLSFIAFCTVAALFPLFFQMLASGSLVEAKLQNMEYELFISQLKKEVQRSEEVFVADGKLVVINGEERVTFQKYGGVLRRQVQGKGHEVVLQNMASVHFSEEGRNLFIEVEDIYQQTNQAKIYPFINDYN